MKTHRFFMGRAVCGAANGVNAADLSPPEVTCRRCPKVDFAFAEGQHYAYLRTPDACRTFVVPGFPPDPMRPWATLYEGPLA